MVCAAGNGFIRSKTTEIYEEMRDYSAFVEQENMRDPFVRVYGRGLLTAGRTGGTGGRCFTLFGTEDAFGG